MKISGINASGIGNFFPSSFLVSDPLAMGISVQCKHYLRAKVGTSTLDRMKQVNRINKFMSIRGDKSVSLFIVNNEILCTQSKSFNEMK